MSRLIVQSRVDSDGVLRVNVPLGIADADREMRVTIEPIVPPITEERAKYLAWLDDIAGQWRGPFERLPQGQFEERDSL